MPKLKKCKVSSKATTKKGKKADNAFVISSYYGFKPIDITEIEKDHHTKAKKLKSKEDYKHLHLPHLEEYVSVLSYAHQNESKVLPMFFYTKGEIKTSKRRRTPSKNIGLHIIGTKKSIAEAILIKTAFSILKEEGYKDLKLEINSLGGKESQIEFNKALTAYFRSKLNELDRESKELLKFGGHTLVAHGTKSVRDILDEAPSAVEFLSEENRIHFKEVIEYLESQKIPFEINKAVVGDPHYSTHTVFTIIDNKTGKILATGTRYDQLAKRVICRKGHPAVSLNITLSRLKKVAASREPNFDKCDTYFIQLGYNAKLKSLEVIELLRKAKIPVFHAIGRDKMSTQSAFANKRQVKYILLLGQKEALGDSVCVRDLESNSQKTLPLDELVENLKKLRKKNKN
jgi:histidyl-tRNA synthetase